VADDDPHTFAWRLRQLEQIEAAIRLELFELRNTKAQRDEVYSRAEAQNMFVKREDLTAAATRRREWPLVFAGVVVALSSVAGLVLQLAGGH
jgi:hypothetical protein